MSIRKAADAMERELSPVMSVVGKIATGIIAFMMLITVIDVVGRRVFNHPLIGAYEMSQFMMVIIVFFTIAHSEFMRSHITVDVLVIRFREKARDVTMSIMYIIFLVSFSFVTWQLAELGLKAWENNLTSALLGIPTFPIIFVTALSSALLCVFILIHVLQYIARTLKK